MKRIAHARALFAVSGLLWTITPLLQSCTVDRPSSNMPTNYLAELADHRFMKALRDLADDPNADTLRDLFDSAVLVGSISTSGYDATTDIIVIEGIRISARPFIEAAKEVVAQFQEQTQLRNNIKDSLFGMAKLGAALGRTNDPTSKSLGIGMQQHAISLMLNMKAYEQCQKCIEILTEAKATVDEQFRQLDGRT